MNRDSKQTCAVVAGLGGISALSNRSTAFIGRVLARCSSNKAQNNERKIKMKNRNSILTPTLLVLAYLGLWPVAQARQPSEDRGSGNSAAEGVDALNLGTTGANNTAHGWFSLFSNTTGSFNTADGFQALFSNTTGHFNTAVGALALFSNTDGTDNTASGAFALFNNTASGNTAVGSRALVNNTTGGTLATIFQGLNVGPNVAVGWQALESNTVASSNTAVGYQALQSFTTGPLGFEQVGLCTAVGFQALANATGRGAFNDAFGYQALMNNTDGVGNTAVGLQALLNNTSGDDNVAIGSSALLDNMTGVYNTAIGGEALVNNTSGFLNTALGFQAGVYQETGFGNVYIGAGVGGVAGEEDHTYIRNINTTGVGGAGTDTVTVNLSTGLLGHLSSSRRYKEDIKAMESASETLYRLKPVTYRYKKEIDPSQSLDYGLVAEEVAKIDPSLANRNRDGQIESVRYNAINAMLLNEFLKEHKKVEQLEGRVASLTEMVKHQAAQIQRVSAQVELTKSGAKVVLNNP
jgi:hypothetical protein